MDTKYSQLSGAGMERVVVDSRALRASAEESVRLRDKANALMKDLASLPPAIQISRLHQANDLYQKAIKISADDTDNLASCWKNRSIAEYTLYEISSDEQLLQGSIVSIIWAIRVGRASKDSGWLQDAANKLSARIASANDYAFRKSNDGRDIRARVLAFMPFKRVLAQNGGGIDNITVWEAIFNQAEAQFKIALSFSEMQDLQTAYQYSQDSIQSIEEARHVQTKPSQDCDARMSELGKNIYVHECGWRAANRSSLADQKLKHILQEEESLNMCGVWEVVDLFREAVTLTRNQDIELEAYCTGRMGVVFDKVIKMAEKARQLYSHCVQLVQTLHPKPFDSIPWYQEVKAGLQRYQEAQYQRDQETRSKAAAKYLEELKPELTAVQEATQKSWQALLRHLYEKHPPKHYKQCEAPVEPLTAQSGKKAVINAVRHYHPDKVDEAEHGTKWKVFCEEVVKMLNAQYEIFKGEDA